MSSLDWNTQTNWLYGAVGSRLDFNRGNDIFQNSAKELHNCYITQTGTLRVMKQWEDQTLAITGDLISVLETRYSFYIVITTTNIYLFDYETHALIGTPLDTTNQLDANCSVFFKDYIAVVKDGVVNTYKFNSVDGSIVVYDFASEMKPPLLERQVVKFDVHKIYEESYIEKTDPVTGVVTIGKKKSISRIASQLTNPEIKLNADGQILLSDQGGKVARIYGEGILDFREEDITLEDMVYGELVINFTTGIPNNLLFDTELVTYDALVTDKTREYVTKFTNTNLVDKEGTLYRGEVIPILTTATAVTVFQNRLVITDEESIYFSKINDHTDFTNYVEDDSPFYIKPNPIINEQPTIKNIYSSRGLYIATDKGVYVMGYNLQLTPTTATVETVSDTPSTNRIAMIDSNFFFIGTDKNLYSIQEDTELSRSRLFKYVVEKYDLNFEVEDITTVRFDKFKRLVVRSLQGDMFLYDVILGVDTFRRTSFDLTYDPTSRLFGVNDDLISKGVVHKFSTVNYKEASIKVHQPSDMMSASSGTLGNDDNTVVASGQIAVINEGGNSVAQVTIDGLSCSNLGDQVNLMSVYNIKNLHRTIEEGFYFKVDTGESTGIVEIVALEYLYSVSGQYE